MTLDRPWFRNWPSDIPTHVDFQEKSIVDLIRGHAAADGDKIALADEMGNKLTYSELWRNSSLFAYSLHNLGVDKGDKVALFTVNSLSAVEALYGLWKAGASVVMIDPTSMSEDLYEQLSDSNPKAIVTDKETYSREKDTLDKIKSIEHRIILGENYEEFKVGDEDFYEKINPRVDNAVIFYYAGIVGRTEQVLHSHFGLYSCSLSSSTMKKITPTSTTLLTSPMTHVLGLMTVLATNLAGGTTAIMRRFNTEKAISMIKNLNVTHVIAAPYVYDQILNIDTNLPSLKLCVSGGAPLSPDTQVNFHKKFKVPLVQEYGMTETLLLTFQLPNLADRVGTVGVPMLGVDAKIVDEGSRELNVGEVGELIVKAPWVMQGYKDPDDTAKAIKDGWVYTGDLMTIDSDGLLYFRGVKKRMIKYKGYPVFPRDLEIILMRHPAVKEVKVEGKEDKEVGQKPVAYVKLREDYSPKPSEEELMNFINQRVAAYKKIRELYIIEDRRSLPTLGTVKCLECNEVFTPSLFTYIDIRLPVCPRCGSYKTVLIRRK
ncbi:MAG TPA: long-chain fatty acid--CoA ligase [Candidatus Caldiarchaeum subterraneum]|uniref:Long-chain fatty acid--CoA ligase n=1 Tax=Caldiarchaeum subterraneum TaxID=311458 RepID=A0A832ZV30_CALS0|nr:long-chain fatty acid--CoA ligase [Candidatus Caldarchaeum subterraneum]